MKHSLRPASATVIVPILACTAIWLTSCRESGSEPKPVATDASHSAARSAGADKNAGAPARPDWTAADLLARALQLDATGDAMALATWFEDLGDAERAALLEALWTADEGAGRAVFAKVFDLWCKRDPQTAARWAVTMWERIPGREGESLREQAGFAWAARDFPTAFAWALELRDAGGEWGLAAKMLKELARHDPRRALALARSVSEEFYAKALNRIFAGWGETDPAAAFAELGVACKEAAAFTHLLGKWADGDPVATVRWLMKHAPEGLPSLSWAAKDPGALVTAVYAANLGGAGEQSLQNYVRKWMEQDPAKAGAWLDALPEDERKTAYIEVNARTRTYDNDGKFVPTSLPFIQRLPAGAARTASLKASLAEWARTDPDAALAWARATGEEELLESTLPGMISALATEATEAALAELASLPPGETRTRSERELAAAWAKKDDAAALAWLQTTQPDWAGANWGGWGGADGQLKRQMFATWVKTSPDAVLAWSADPANAKSHQGLFDGLLELASWREEGNGNLQLAMSLAKRLPDQQIRARAVENVGLSWAMSRDREQAKREIEADPTQTAKEKQGIFALLENLERTRAAR